MTDEPRDERNGGVPSGDATGTRQTAGTGESASSEHPVGTGPAAADASRVPSAPWERPRRWDQDALDATRVDDLLARLGTGDEIPSGRRRRRQDGAAAGAGVAASELIAALSDDESGTEGSSGPPPGHHILERPAGVPAAHAPDPTGPDSTATPPPAATPATAPPTSAPPPSAPPPSAPPPSAPPMSAPPMSAPPTSAPPAPAPSALPVSAPDAPVQETPTPSATGADERTAALPPRIGPGEQAPIRDLGDDPRTDYIPKMTGSVADRAEADSILASLRRQSRSGAPGYGTAAGYGTAGASDGTTGAPLHDDRTPPIPPAGSQGGHRPSDLSPRRRWLLHAGRGIAAAVALMTLLGMGVEWNIKDRADVGLRQHSVSGALNTTDPNISSARTAPLVMTNSKGVQTTEAAPPKATYAPENILLLGSDTRAGNNGNAGNQGAGTSGTANSDTLMVAHISGDRSHVTILSIPRDTLIPAPKCKIWDAATGKVSDQYEPSSAGQIYHINSAYSVGGPLCTVTAVQSLTHLGITRMIGIDFAGFKSMVDALGGINVNICRPIVDRVLQTVVPTAGEQKIFGLQALNLVRARDVIGDDLSDLARIRRQQVVLSAILRQVTTAGTLLNPAKLDNFLQAFTNNTFTKNVKVDDLITLAGSLGSLDPAHVTFYTMPTVPSTVIDGALDVDRAKAAIIFDDLINDLPLPGEVTATATGTAPATPTPTPASPSLKLTMAPARVSVEIYNFTGRARVATSVQQKLNAIGFHISGRQLLTPDAGSQTATTVLYAAANRAAALTVAAAVPGSKLVVTAGLGNTVRLDLGSSYAGTIAAVKVGQDAPSSLSAVSTGPSINTAAGSGSVGTLASTALSSVNAGAGTCV